MHPSSEARLFALADVAPDASDRVPQAMHTKIKARLSAIEQSDGVRVLHACESGSRAWNFASPDSDFDVRFIYARDVAWYLSPRVERKRDVIEHPVDAVWDVNGWDVRKALMLAARSNPPLFEWLSSPIVYQKDDAALATLRAVATACFSPRAVMHHYLSMAQKTMPHLEGDAEGQVRHKKYLYALRPVFACRHVAHEIAHEARDAAGPRMPPLDFDQLRALDRETAPAAHAVPTAVHDAIDALLVRKRAAGEMATGPAITVLNTWLKAELDRLPAVCQAAPAGGFGPDDTEVRNALLDDAFRVLIGAFV